MELPTNRRDQIVMGLSICALILFMANMATFIKQRFFDEGTHLRHTMVISSEDHHGDIHVHATESGHVWHVRPTDGDDMAWSVAGDDVDGELRRVEQQMQRLERELIGQERTVRRRFDRRHNKRQGRFMWKFEDGRVTELQRDLDRNTAVLLEEAKRAASRIEGELELSSSPRLHVETILGEGVDVIESQDEAGRHRYRVVVKPSGSN